MSEHDEQVALMQWAALKPELEGLFAIPNGGDRHMLVAKKLKAEGARKGVPDLFLPLARGGYHGLFIEMKAPGGKGKRKGVLSKDQAEWIIRLQDNGYECVVAYGFEDAKDKILEYLIYGQVRNK